MSDDNSSESKLLAVSINLLFDGMVLQDSVYDAEASRLLVKSGSLLDANTIKRIKSLNSGRETIFVTGNTYSTLIANNPPIEASNRNELEDSTGYTAIKDVTQDLLEEISRDQGVPLESLHSISSELSHQVEMTSTSTLLSLINALAPEDEYLQRHSINVSLLNGLMGRWLGLEKPIVDKLILIGLLHDCGKTLIPPEVLHAPRKLLIGECEVMKMHSVYTYELLAKFPEAIRLASRSHHEKANGTGYPDRLPIGKTPWEARVTCISDIYDAVVSQRVYKKPRSPFSVLKMMNEIKGKELDPDLANVFVQKMPIHLMGKHVLMSDGSIGILRSFDPDDIEYPTVGIGDYVFKSDENLYCLSMYNEETPALDG